MKADLKTAQRDGNAASRPYVVVNPLLGKHIPVKPSSALEYFAQLGLLVAKACANERVLVIGFAETATAVGAAVAGEIENAVYVHTTRETLNPRTLVSEFLEEHSHARNQALYLNNDFSDLKRYDRLVFVEDEITTGKTILNFLNDIRYKGKITVAALVFNGFNEEAFSKYDAEFCCIQKIGYISKLQFKGLPNPRMGVNITEYKRKCLELAAYAGASMDIANKSVLVLGTEEFMYPAICIGRELENAAESVKTHSTTRSPIIDSGNPFFSRHSFPSVYDNSRETYLYNLGKYDVIIIVTDAHGELDGLLNILRGCATKIYVMEMSE